MKNNPYIEVLTREFSNKLHTLSEQDLRDYNNPNHNKYAPREFNNSYSLFDTFLNTFNFTADDIFYIENETRGVNQKKLSSLSNRIIELIFSEYYQFNTKRLGLLNIFYDTIKNNELAFKESLTFCLTHSNIREHNLDEQTLNTIENNNFSLFKHLVDIGIEQKYFDNIPSQLLNAKNKLYINYLIEKKIFNNDFSFERLQENLDFLKKGRDNTNYKEYELNDAFIKSHIVDIVELSKNNSQFIETLKYEKLFDVFLDKFFSTTFTSDHLEPKDLNTKINELALLLINNSDMSETFLNNLSDKKNLLFSNQFAPTLIKLLDSIDNEQKENVFKLKINSYYYANNHNEEENNRRTLQEISFHHQQYSGNKYSFSNFLSSCLSNLGNSEIDSSLIEYFVDNFTKYNPPKIANFYIASWLLEYTKIPFDFQRQENQDAKDNYFKTNKFEVLKKYSSYIQYCFEPINNKITANNLHYLSLIKKFIEDNSFLNKYEKILLKNVKDNFYNYFSNHSSTNVNNNYFEKNTSQQTLQLLATYSNLFPMNHFIDVLSADENNPEWKDIKLFFEYKDRKLDKNKSKEDYPLPFALIDLSEGKALEQFITDDNLKHFSTLKYKGKNIISYFIKNNHYNDNKLILNMMDILINHPNEQPLKALITDNKPSMKAFEEFCSDPKIQKIGIKQKVLFKILDNTVSEEKIPNSIEKASTPIHRTRKI